MPNTNSPWKLGGRLTSALVVVSIASMIGLSHQEHNFFADKTKLAQSRLMDQMEFYQTAADRLQKIIEAKA